MSRHVVLLGDSVFDNRAYTGGEPDVLAHLRAILPPGWDASLGAVDGSFTTDLPAQLVRIPGGASHLVVSIGGNDALRNMDLLATPVSSTAQALALFANRRDRFESSYRAVALTMFNDVILRVAFERRLTVIDLRLICNEPADYANPIEPSGPGGRKIAAAIARAAGAADERTTRTEVVAHA